MTQVKDGDKVAIHYTGKLKRDGSVFDSSEGREPLAFTVGSGQLIRGLDSQIPGMEVGDKKTVEISVMMGYGPRHLDKVFDFPVEQLPPDIPREVGLTLAMRDQEGNEVPVTITEVTETHIKLDGNHRLAGEELVFDVELVSIG